MKEVEVNKQAMLSEHFSLGEMTKTSYHPIDGNIPNRVAIENMINLCENWLEELRARYNLRYVVTTSYGQTTPPAGTPPDSGGETEMEAPIIINSGFRSAEVNRLCGGAIHSNHLTGCAVDIRCMGKDQAIRYACILLDIADGKKMDLTSSRVCSRSETSMQASRCARSNADFDELILEKRGTTIWVHFAVRPRGNRRYVHF